MSIFEMIAKMLGAVMMRDRSEIDIQVDPRSGAPIAVHRSDVGASRPRRVCHDGAMSGHSTDDYGIEGSGWN